MKGEDFILDTMPKITSPWDTEGKTVPWGNALVTLQRKADWYGISYCSEPGDKGLWIESEGAWMKIHPCYSPVHVRTGDFREDE